MAQTYIGQKRLRKYYGKIREVLDNLIKADLVERGLSDFCSPVFMVKKADGRLRLVSGYTKLNTKLKHEFYTIPNLRDQLKRYLS